MEWYYSITCKVQNFAHFKNSLPSGGNLFSFHIMEAGKGYFITGWQFRNCTTVVKKKGERQRYVNLKI